MIVYGKQMLTAIVCVCVCERVCTCTLVRKCSFIY